MAIRLEQYFDRVTDGYNQLAILFDSGHWTASDESARASLVYDAKEGRMYWSSRVRSGTTGEWAARELGDILAIAGGDEQVRTEILAVTDRAKRLARKRVHELRATGDAGDAAVADRLAHALNSEWLRPPRR